MDLPTTWHDWYNATVYQSYVDEFPIYHWLNRELARASRLDGANRILDLACGTGATALGCLPEMGRDAELVGLDSAWPMVEIARAEVLDPRCRFVVGDARQLSQHLDGTFDRVVCNAAFWQLPDPARVLEELSRVVNPGARLTLSIPSQYLTPEQSTAHPFQIAMARHLGSSAGPPRAVGRSFHSIDALTHLLGRGGFRTEQVAETHYQSRQEELIELMRIPAMTSSIAEGISEADCRIAISRAAAEVDPDQRVTVSWTLVCAVF